MNTPIIRAVYAFILYLFDGVMILGGMELLITRFFGYKAKPKKSRRVLFAIILAVYILISFLVFIVVSVDKLEIYLLSELAYIFAIIYWLNNLEERKRWRKVVTVFTAFTVISLLKEMMNHFASLFLIDNNDYFMAMGVSILIAVIEFGIVTGMSFLSSRKRKEPMSLSLIVIACIVFIFVLIVDNIFYQAEDGIIKPIITMDLIVSEALINGILGYTFIVILILFTGITIFMMIKESEAQYFQKKNTISEYYLDAQKQHYEALSESNKEIRKIKHDMKNHLYCLQGLYESGNYEELGKYLHEMDESFQHIAVTNFVGHEIADAIISEKKHKAEEKNISLTAEGALYGVELAAIDVCTIFSNILDNAIEATEKLPEDKRRIVLKVGHNKNYLLISEYNPIEKVPDISDNRIATTKTNSSNHGFGITNVKDAAAKYDGDVQLFVEDSKEYGEKYFHIEVMLPIQSYKNVTN